MFKESVDLILDDTGRGSKPNVTEKTWTLISDPLDEDRLLTLLYSMIRDSVRFTKNYSETLNGLTKLVVKYILNRRTSLSISYRSHQIHSQLIL